MQGGIKLGFDKYFAEPIFELLTAWMPSKLASVKQNKYSYCALFMNVLLIFPNPGIMLEYSTFLEYLEMVLTTIKKNCKFISGNRKGTARYLPP
jgi:hypothetical protein